MIKKGIIKLVIPLLVIQYQLVQAATINYDESIDGDIKSSTPVFNLGAGTNTISGSMWLFEQDFIFDFDTDDFSIYVPDNTVLSSVSVIFSIRNDPNSDDATSVDIGYGMSDCFQNSDCGFSYTDMIADTLYSYDAPDQYEIGPNDFSGISIGGVSPPDVPLIEDMTDLQGGNYYNFTAVSIGWSSGGLPVDDNFDYTFTFNVTPVPVPAAVWLFVSGLMMLMSVTRKRHC